MLYIESIEYKEYGAYDFSKYPCLNYDRDNATNGIVYVTLRDTRTGCVETLSTAHSAAAFERDIVDRDPYGYTPHSKYTSSFILTAIDKMSLQFLELVESVEPVTFVENDTRLTSGLRYDVYDDFGTFLEEDCYFGTDAWTLFQVIYKQSGGWNGDVYYFTVDGDGSEGMCVTFTDAAKARAFIAKASTMGYSLKQSRYFKR